MRVLTLGWNNEFGGTCRPLPRWSLSNNDQLPTFPFYYGGDSPPFGLPFAFRFLIGMRCWDNFEGPPQTEFGQRVGDWLHGI